MSKLQPMALATGSPPENDPATFGQARQVIGEMQSANSAVILQPGSKDRFSSKMRRAAC